ncbi:MAG: lipoyl synthase [Myxococcota bacterium]
MSQILTEKILTDAVSSSGQPAAKLATAAPVMRKPEWLRPPMRESEGFRALKKLARSKSLVTVCEEARCPNIYECWSHRTATFMLFGDTCTRRCGFCAVKTGLPGALNPHEPEQVADAVKTLGLQHVVITSVNRDDLKDGGAPHFAETIRRVRQLNPETRVEVLIPDFQGKPDCLHTVMEARPDVLAHNIETVPRLYRHVRVGSRYVRSLQLLERAKGYHAPQYPVLTKTGVMVGLGETRDELLRVMDELRAHGVDILTLGQYLQPDKSHLPVIRFYHPDEFAELKAEGMSRGFQHVESGPLVRSSYHAHDHVPADAPRQQVEPTRSMPSPLMLEV